MGARNESHLHMRSLSIKNRNFDILFVLQKREQIFNDYMREKYKTAKEDFKNLLLETKIITHKYE